MKEEKMLRAFSLVDDDLVENAAPKSKKPKIPLGWKRLAYIAVAASLMLVILLPLLFGGGHDSVPVPTTGASKPPFAPGQTAADTTQGVPGQTAADTTQGAQVTLPTVPDTTRVLDVVPSGPLNEYRDSEYFLLIEKLNAYLSEAEIELPPSQPTAPDIAPDGVTDDFSGNMMGADSIQRSDSYIFCLKDEKIEAYTLSGLDFECVGAFDVGDKSEFYLLDGGKKILLLGSSSLWTRLLLLDVSDPTNMKEIRRVRITGKISSFYMTEDGFLLGTNYTVWEKPSYDIPSSFVPYMEYDGGAAWYLPMEDILMTTEDLLGLDYAVLYSLDPETLELQSRKAILGTAGTIYVSNEHVFVAKSYRHESRSADYLTYTSKDVCDIYCLSYQGGALVYKGRVTLDGQLTGPYGFDEKDGILRVVTEWGYIKVTTRGNNNKRETYIGASLYCVSLETFEVIARVEKFSPNGEFVQSVRFDDDFVYVSTAQSTSASTPIFFLDLSDLSNIICVAPDEPGARSSAIMLFGSGNLLGIGYGHKEFVGSPSPHMIEVFRKEGNKMVSVDRYLVENDAEATGHKPSYLDRDYYVDLERQLVGFAVMTKDEDNSTKTEYILLHFDGKTLSEFARVEIDGDPCAVRTILIHGNLHVFSDKEHKVIPV